MPVMRNPPHPGWGLKADFEELRLSTAQAAAAIGVSQTQLSRVMMETRAISPELALRLEVVIGGTAEAWVLMQVAYDISHMRERAANITKGLKRIKAPAAPNNPSPLMIEQTRPWPCRERATGSSGERGDCSIPTWLWQTGGYRSRWIACFITLYERSVLKRYIVLDNMNHVSEAKEYRRNLNHCQFVPIR